jgi:hypothetical protein
MSACMDVGDDFALSGLSKAKDDIIDRAVQSINELAETDQWVGVHILMGWHGSMLSESKDPKVLEFLDRMRSELKAGRAERGRLEAGLLLPADGSVIWWCPDGIKASRYEP